MSFCPFRLLPSRFRPRPTSCLAGQRLRSELYYPRRFAGARFLNGNVSQSNTALPTDVYDGLGNHSWSHDIDSEVEDSTHKEVSTPLDGLTDHTKTGNTRYTQYNRDGTSHTYTRLVGQGLLDADAQIKARTLYNGPDQFKQWRLVCKAITDRRSEAVGLQTDSSLLSIDEAYSDLLRLKEEDKFLLEPLEKERKLDFRDRWENLSKAQKADHWPRLSLSLLNRCPSLIPAFLRITCQAFDRPSFVMIYECINHLLRFFPDLVAQSLVTECMHPRHWPILVLPQRAVRIYLNRAKRDDVLHAFGLFGKWRMHISPQTLLCFMKRFTDFGDVESALQAFERFLDVDRVLLLNSEMVIRHCCKLLTLDSVMDNGGERNFRILPRLLELGVRPTRDMMNVVLANAFRAGDSQVAQGILEYMREQKLEPDAFTYLALLKDAVRTADGERLAHLLHEIEVREEVRQNPWILSKILHSHFLSIAKEGDLDDNPNEIFYSMLALYIRLHDITPLKELAILPGHYVPPDGSGDSPPSVVALYIMIATYLRCTQNAAKVEFIYSRFRQLVLQNHPSIAPLAETDHTYNEFLIAYRAESRGLRPAARLVEDMLQASQNKGPASNLGDGGMRHVSPTVRTWTILMSCFVFNKQPLAVEKVRAMMSKHNIRYNTGAWNMVINNYANSQNIASLAQAIKQMEREGIAPDNYTLNSLRYLRDPERLWAALDELDRASDERHGLSHEQGPVQEEVKQQKNEDDELLDQGLLQIKGHSELKG